MFSRHRLPCIAYLTITRVILLVLLSHDSPPLAVPPSADAWANAGPSQALPFATAPATLDGSMIGDAGFDPLGFSTVPVGPWFNGIEGRDGQIGNLNWYREAELIHGRIAQVAVLGLHFSRPLRYPPRKRGSWLRCFLEHQPPSRPSPRSPVKVFFRSSSS